MLGSTRCQHYADRGACSLPDVFMCVEWVNRNPHLASGMRADVLIDRLRATEPPAERSATQPAPPRAPEPAGAPERPWGPPLTAELVTPEAVEALSARGYAFDLDTDHGPVRLVPELTEDDPEVPTLTFQDARVLTVVTSAFPGARVKSIRRKK